jgi:hypothetical protein
MSSSCRLVCGAAGGLQALRNGVRVHVRVLLLPVVAEPRRLWAAAKKQSRWASTRWTGACACTRRT